MEPEREVGEKWWAATEAVPQEDGTRMWGVAFVKCVGFHMGEPDADPVDYADAYLKSRASAERLARKLNKRDGFRSER
jgi:hypothetical protein